MVCIGWHVEQEDAAGNRRRVIVFELAPVQSVDRSEAPLVGANSHEESNRFWSMPLNQLRQTALQTVGEAAPTRQRVTNARIRSQAVRVYVLRRAKGVCERCGKPAPFVTVDGRPYLEPHHIKRIADGGPDNPKWVGAVCPNCHREAHHGVHRDHLNQDLLAKIVALEEETSI
jgi:5-methylcytosine-specific restriction protein A